MNEPRDEGLAPVDIEQRNRNRRTLVIMAVIGVVPFAVAWMIYFHLPGLIPSTTTNKGTLVHPPVSAAPLETTTPLPEGKWTLLVPAGEVCDDTCQHALYLARQVNVALGKDQDRVERALLVSGSQVEPAFHELLTKQYPDMAVRYYPSDVVDNALAPIIGGKALNGYIFIADPKGNIMMFYSPEHTGNDILKDLQHLLKYSSIG